MKSVTLEIEAIGLYQKISYLGSMIKVKSRKPPWVAEILDFDDFGNYRFIREFVDPMVDYTRSNSVGSRGIYYYFHLFPGKLYEISGYETWEKNYRYFARVYDGQLIEMTKEEAIVWLSNF
jgi:hypothetical protein